MMKQLLGTSNNCHRPRFPATAIIRGPLLCICTISLVASCSSWAGDQQNRFLEIPNERITLTFDLDTVQMISPGRFTIMSTRIDNPDVMKLELKTITTLSSYCVRPDGKYPAPTELLQLGPPDLPVEQIEVRSSEIRDGGTAYPFKMVSWKYPYARLASDPGIGFLHCKQSGRSETDLFMESYNLITNGLGQKELFDCKRGLSGIFLHSDDDATKAYAAPVRKATNGFFWYRAVCRAVMHQEPYLPE
jgi:hypothetical protein